ncbi:MAG: YjjG family noncanonical pyrimidine nucleotidase [Prevotellaceae bacterium]|nr:YjjG family noncanonical pyrimidine nucleotidase [Prevotellaceae bacterium]
MKRYHNIFIDLDDTIYDTRGNADMALRQLYDHFQLGRYFTSFEAFHEPYWLTNIMLWADYAQGRITRDYLIMERFRRPLSEGKGLEVTPELCLSVSAFFLDACSNLSDVVEDAHEVLAYLKEKGYRLHLCTNGFHEVQYKKMKASGLDVYFDKVILSEDAGANKPSADFFEYALRETGADRETTLMIGDNFITDIEGAKGVGIDVMFFNRRPSEFSAPSPVNYEIHALREIRNIL